MKEQWKQGLQWGGVIWLGWLALSSVALVVDCASAGFFAQLTIPAVGWTIALLLSWTRWSRAGVAIGIAAQVYGAVFVEMPPIGRADYMFQGVMTQSYLDLEPLLSSFLPRCLPVVPLLFLNPERPRYTAALALIGRWTDAAREMMGMRWILVAAGVLTLHTAAPEALKWWYINDVGVVRFWWTHVGGALAPSAILFGVAALRLPGDRSAR